MCGTGFAQETAGNLPVITVSFPQDSLMIGDQPVVKVTVDKDVTQIVGFPEFRNEPGSEFEILSQSEIDTVRLDNRRETLTREYRFAVFAPGEYNLGKINLLYIDKNITDTIQSADSVYFRVKPILINPEEDKIFTVKPPVKMPVTFAEILPYLLWTLLGLVIIAAAIYVIIRWKKNKSLLPQKPKLPPHVVAINELERIREKNLWQSGKVKQYYTEITDVVRQYLNERYNVNAMEMTTDEILDVMQYLINRKSKGYEMLGEILKLSDLVKFAKWNPTTGENQITYDNAYYFVESTKQIPEQENAEVSVSTEKNEKEAQS